MGCNCGNTAKRLNKPAGMVLVNTAAASTPTVYQRRDPTRTTTLRNRYAAEMRKRFTQLRGQIWDAIVTQDVFGIAGGHEGLRQADTNNVTTLQANQTRPGRRAFAFTRMPDKVGMFMRWLEIQVERGLLETSRRQQFGQAIESSWQDIYIEDSYKRGVQRAAYEIHRGRFPGQSVEERGGIQAVLGTPMHLDRVGVIYTRAFRELKGITDTMDQHISRVLAQGMADGDGPRTLARKINATITGAGAGELGIRDSLGRFIPAQRRAEILARTEVIRAHHSGMMQEYRNWGVEGVSVVAEFRTAGDDRVCDECAGLEGQFFSLDEAENLIPVHPQCRCIVMPARPEDAAAAQAVAATTDLDDELGTLLASGDITDVKGLGGGVNETRIVTFRDGRKGVFKPESGERWGVRSSIGNRDLSYADREVLASRIDQEMGLGLVPRTEFRTINGERGSVQFFVDGTEEAHALLGRYSGADLEQHMKTDEMYRASVFDQLIGNTDRHTGNMLFKDGVPALIDNGLAFPGNNDDISSRTQQVWEGYRYGFTSDAERRYLAAVSQATKDEMIRALENLDLDKVTSGFNLSFDEADHLESRRERLLHQLRQGRSPFIFY